VVGCFLNLSSKRPYWDGNRPVAAMVRTLIIRRSIREKGLLPQDRLSWIKTLRAHSIFKESFTKKTKSWDMCPCKQNRDSGWL